MGPIGCPETSARDYHHSQRNNPEERSSHQIFFKTHFDIMEQGISSLLHCMTSTCKYSR